MLINCPECGKEISDKSEQCIHCGFLLRKKKENVCTIAGIDYDFTFIMDRIEKTTDMWVWRMVKDQTHMHDKDCDTLGDFIFKTKTVPETYEPKYPLEAKESATNAVSSRLKCPYCGSTDVKKISATSRVVSVGMFGLASKKVGKQFHCNRCKADF